MEWAIFAFLLCAFGEKFMATTAGGFATCEMVQESVSCEKTTVAVPWKNGGGVGCDSTRCIGVDSFAPGPAVAATVTIATGKVSYAKNFTGDLNGGVKAVNGPFYDKEKDRFIIATYGIDVGVVVATVDATTFALTVLFDLKESLPFLYHVVWVPSQRFLCGITQSQRQSFLCIHADNGTIAWTMPSLLPEPWGTLNAAPCVYMSEEGGLACLTNIGYKQYGFVVISPENGVVSYYANLTAQGLGGVNLGAQVWLDKTAEHPEAFVFETTGDFGKSPTLNLKDHQATLSSSPTLEVHQGFARLG